MATAFPTHAPAAGERDDVAEPPSASAFYAAPGPWGRLRCYYIYLEPTMRMMIPYAREDARPRWSFPLGMAGRLPQLFKEAGLAEEFILALIDPLNRQTAGTFLHLYPPPEHLTAMRPESRQVIYKELARHAPNQFYTFPVLMTTKTVDDWLRGSRLPGHMKDHMRQMAYPYGDGLAFCDVDFLASIAKSEEERLLILKTTARARSLMIEVEVDRSTDIEALISYWTLGDPRRRKDIEPIIRSIQESDGIRSLDLTHFLPPLARSLLYTYPDPSFAAHGENPDCHWTSQNFLNNDPTAHIYDQRLAASYFEEQFETVSPPYRYGDVLLFYDNAEKILIHSCIYLADDLVFTKNGLNPLRPWVINRIREVEMAYAQDASVISWGIRKRRQGS